MTLRLGLLSTARINAEILAAASGVDRVEVVAVASRDGGTGRGLRARARARSCPRLVRGAPRRRRGGRDLHPAPERPPPRVDDALHSEPASTSSARSRTRATRPRSRRRSTLAEQAGLVLMEAFMYRHHPQTTTRRGARRERCGRDAARDPGDLHLPARACRRRAARPGARRRLADGRGLLLRERVAAARGRARARARRAGRRGNGRRPRVPRDAALRRRRGRPDRLLVLAAAIPASRGARRGGLRRRRVALADRTGAATCSCGETASRAAIDVPTADMFRLELENFAAAVAGDAPPLLGRADALGQARAIDALYRSAAEGADGHGVRERQRLDRPVRDAPAGELARADRVDQVRPTGPEADVLDVRPRRPGRRRDVRVEDRELVALVLEEPRLRRRRRARSGTARRPRSARARSAPRRRL